MSADPTGLCLGFLVTWRSKELALSGTVCLVLTHRRWCYLCTSHHCWQPLLQMPTLQPPVGLLQQAPFPLVLPQQASRHPAYSQSQLDAICLGQSMVVPAQGATESDGLHITEWHKESRPPLTYTLRKGAVFRLLQVSVYMCACYCTCACICFHKPLTQMCRSPCHLQLAAAQCLQSALSASGSAFLVQACRQCAALGMQEGNKMQPRVLTLLLLGRPHFGALQPSPCIVDINHD